jgi:hypothetical protein
MKSQAAIRSCTASAAALILLLSVACSRDPIVGRWERFGDDFAGTEIRVTGVGRAYTARLDKVPEALKSHGFAPGEIKWRNLVFVSDSEGVRKYQGEDMGHNVPKEGKPETRYTKFVLEVNGDTAMSKVYHSDLNVMGMTQMWRKLR